MNQRIIKRKSIHNLRTLCGLENSMGQKVGANKLYRSAALDQLNEKDAAFLREKYQIKKIIDLRTNGEIEKHPNLHMERFEYVHLPVFGEAIPGISREVEPGRADNLKEGMLPDLRDMYRELVSDPECIENFRIILKEIMNHRDGGILWHCTAGKDRCGMISVLIEAMLGMSRKTIRDDYVMTNLDSKKTAIKYFLLITIFKRDLATAKMVYRAYLAHESYLYSAMKAMEDLYGGTQNYITDVLKIDRKEIREFRKYILEID
ncbi:MAG: tyrosine-protein phosphatase [Eubacteriales bacterium]|nr:tyrosine-protein phosphatase [Eubacteriales bacterium]